MSKQTLTEKTAAAIEAAAASFDAAATDDTGKITGQFEATGRALFAAASIAPLSLEILQGIASEAAARSKKICTQYANLLKIASEGITAKERMIETAAAHKALIDKAIKSGKTPEEIAAFLIS